MLSCRELSETASDYLEGTLTLRQRVGVTMHLLMCRHCRAYVDQLAKTVALLKSARAGQDSIEPSPRVIEVFRNGVGKP